MMNRKQKIAGGFTAAAAAAMIVVIPFLKEHEGLSLKAYLDAARVWTICYGHAYVSPGLRLSEKQCDALLKSDIIRYMKPVYDAMKYEPSPFVLAAHTSFAYNVGVAGYKKSQTLKITNTGDVVGGCKAMANWYKSDGRDCRIDRKCRGVWNRRQDEIKLCLRGAS